MREALRDLDDRLSRAMAHLESRAAGEPAIAERYRLIGKAQGVNLARSYVHEAMRSTTEEA